MRIRAGPSHNPRSKLCGDTTPLQRALYLSRSLNLLSLQRCLLGSQNAAPIQGHLGVGGRIRARARVMGGVAFQLGLGLGNKFCCG